LLPLLVSQTPLTVGKNAFAPAANRHSCAVTGNHPADFATVLAGPLHHAVAQFDTDTKERIRNGIGLETAPAAGFRDVAAEVGLKFHHFTGATGDYFMPEIMGAGGALLDYDNDGDLDVFLIQGTILDDKKKLVFPPPQNWKPGN